MCLPCWRRLLAAVYGEGGDCSASNPDIAPSSRALDCTEPPSAAPWWRARVSRRACWPFRSACCLGAIATRTLASQWTNRTSGSANRTASSAAPGSPAFPPCSTAVPAMLRRLDAPPRPRNGCDARGAVHSRGEAGDAASTFARCKHCSSRWRRAAGSPSTAGCWSLARASWASRGYCHVNDITMSIQLFSCILRRAQVQHRYAGPTDRSPLHGIAWRKAPGNRCYRIVRLRVSPLKAIQREAMHVPTAPRVISNGITRAKLTSALHTDGVSGR
jgi:hypothetical protein